MACTATATPKVMKDIQSCLQLPIQHQGRLDRHNIYYKVQYNHNNNNNNHNNANNNNNQSNNNNSKSNLPPLQHLCQTIRELYYEKNDWKTTKGGGGCGIVYVHKRDDTTMLARAITTKAKVPAAAYHAGLPKQERQRVLEEFIRGSTSTSTSTDSQQKNNPPPLKIVVATVAFGMGIDVANVRVVIHWNMPKSLEAFAQESGRAGRDGLPCHSILYYNPEDYSKYQFLLHKQYESKINNNNQKNKRTTTNDTAAAASSSSPSAEQFLQAKLEALDQMRDYCTLPQCRRKTILLHFGGGTSTTQEEEDVCQQTCDYCSNPKLVTRNLQSMLVSKRSTTFSNNTRTNDNNNKNKWDGQWKKPHGDDGNTYDDYDDDNNNDWGDGFVGDLQVTGSLSYGGGADGGDNSNKRRKMGGFTKASSLLNVLNKYEKMEENSSNQQERNSGFVRFGVNNKSTTAIIPEHFKASTVNNHSTATKPKTSVAKPPEKSAKELQQDLDRINAEREKRMQALLSKQKKRKEEAAAKAATSSSATATVQAPPTLTFGSHKRRRT
eukprot:scaffold2447_cov110-Cylindrotheca_fusiformis.AAC.13